MSDSTKVEKSPLSWIHPHAAGIDIGSKEHYVAVDPSGDSHPVRRFGCTTPELMEMGRFLQRCGVTTIAMESTGVYWVPVARFLECHFEMQVCLVDPHHVRSVPGRKTDVQDCQWLQQLHSFGLLSSVFRVPKEYEAIRTYERHRKTLVQATSQHVLRMQKALEVMNVQLHKVLSDITGVTGMLILRAIVAGERDPVALAHHRNGRVKLSESEIAKALAGNFLPDQVFVLEQALQAYDFAHQQILACDHRIEAAMATLQAREGRQSDAVPIPPKTYRRKNQSHFDLRRELVRVTGIDLTRIPGIDALTAQTVISEIGSDVSAFPTEKHFASWLALCPNHRITGGRVRSRKTRPSANRIATALRVAAQTLHRSKAALGAAYRRLRAKLGAPKAITAVAHKLALLIYRMLKHGEAYVEKGQAWYDNQYRERVLANLKRSAKEHGLTLVPDLLVS